MLQDKKTEKKYIFILVKRNQHWGLLDRLTFEYILFDGLNESREDAERLVQLCRRVPAARVNIIEYNPIDQARFQKSEQQRRERFVDYLHQHRVTAKVRRSRGKDIDAACGQLANK